MNAGEWAHRCLFCGGDASEPDHFAHCDGRQGHVDEDLPPLISGIVQETWDTSEAAALAVEDSRDTQRARVLHEIQRAGLDGRTDDELQQALGIDGSSERPRRWELWKLDRITILRDPLGREVRRLTRTHRRAVVWIDRSLAPETAAADLGT